MIQGRVLEFLLVGEGVRRIGEMRNGLKRVNCSTCKKNALVLLALQSGLCIMQSFMQSV